tara:strand:- start:44 stop:340 length:297 start_codon:yes stop_codon:yes gene_type:complete
MPKTDEREKDNIVFTCKEHGKETYFKIKKLEKMRKMREYVYVWFDVDGLTEKMWVRIISGDRQKGMGKLDNVPTILEHLRLGDLIRFKTDKEGITWGL